MKYRSPLALIHETPLVELPSVSRRLGRRIFLKLESANPGGSMKDRIALHCVEQAERAGLLRAGYVIIESTSGSLGISLSMVGAQKGYRVICVVDPKVTNAARRAMELFGATVVCVNSPDAHGNYLAGRIARVRQLLSRYSPSWWCNQYDNPDNPGTHFKFTAPELLRDMDGDIDWIVCPVGTGGLAGGVARFFREHLPTCSIMAVDAVGSVALNGPPGPRHQVGIGSSQRSKHLDLNSLDELVYVSDAEAFKGARMLAEEEGLCLGCSTGSALAGLIQRLDRTSAGSRIVVIAADSGLKYMDTIYDPGWLAERTGVIHSKEMGSWNAGECDPIAVPTGFCER